MRLVPTKGRQKFGYLLICSGNFGVESQQNWLNDLSLPFAASGRKTSSRMAALVFYGLLRSELLLLLLLYDNSLIYVV